MKVDHGDAGGDREEETVQRVNRLKCYLTPKR